VLFPDLDDISGEDIMEVILTDEESRSTLYNPPPTHSTQHQTRSNARSTVNDDVNGRDQDGSASVGVRSNVPSANFPEANSGAFGAKDKQSGSALTGM
jgi:hypothetical protein